MSREILEAMTPLRPRRASPRRPHGGPRGRVSSRPTASSPLREVRAGGARSRYRRLPSLRAPHPGRSRRSCSSSTTSRRARSTRRPVRSWSCPTPARLGQGRRAPRPHRRAGRHAVRLRPHRRDDRQAGHPPPRPRGRARARARRVPRPRRRAHHRHRPAEGLTLHAGAAARPRRGAAPKSEQVWGESYTAQPAHQGRDQGGRGLPEGPVDHRCRAATPS